MRRPDRMPCTCPWGAVRGHERTVCAVTTPIIPCCMQPEPGCYFRTMPKSATAPQDRLRIAAQVFRRPTHSALAQHAKQSHCSLPEMCQQTAPSRVLPAMYERRRLNPYMARARERLRSAHACFALWQPWCTHSCLSLPKAQFFLSRILAGLRRGRAQKS